MLNQLSDVMKKLAKEVMPKLVQDAHQKSSDAVSEVADDRRAFDTTLFERISNQVGLQEKLRK